ncbi:hypothetical protein BJ878DRAFT_488999 [Calycina marina]|uniref:Uncharacterized protein n=1 Tax=Calycina marina TaxID=1763456 RepID=A0A9P7ZAT0_9HELO|nr:hypothetical protein BJ878DRAFT_488999 [Calycina marina]
MGVSTTGTRGGRLDTVSRQECATCCRYVQQRPFIEAFEVGAVLFNGVMAEVEEDALLFGAGRFAVAIKHSTMSAIVFMICCPVVDYEKFLFITASVMSMTSGSTFFCLALFIMVEPKASSAFSNEFFDAYFTCLLEESGGTRRPYFALACVSSI